MGIFRGIFDFFKKEIELNKEYYDGLKVDDDSIPEPKKETTAPNLEIKRQPISEFDPGTQVRTDTYTVYYAYGHVSHVFPPLPGGYYDNRDIINAATFIVSDGVAYDLTDKKSIYSIKVPNYHIYVETSVGEELGVTGYLDYVLRMHAGLAWGVDMDISFACLEKATQLMKYSTLGWRQKDFYRIVNWYIELGKFKKAREWERWILQNTKSEQDIRDDVFQQCIDSCEYLDTDLVQVGDSGVCCEKCAMYRNRIYSLAGADRRFPKLPTDFHMDCGLSVSPFVYGVNEPSFKCADTIKYSNRPFVDDRTPEDISRREEWLVMVEKERQYTMEASLSKITYYKLKQILPDDAPKSLSGFSRMRNANSKNYQALVKKAEAAGFVFPETLEDVEKWPENQ